MPQRKRFDTGTIVIRGENNMTIKDLKPGMSATVQTLLGHGALKRRMLDMSLRGEDAESVSVAA